MIFVNTCPPGGGLDIGGYWGGVKYGGNKVEIWPTAEILIIDIYGYLPSGRRAR